MILLKVILGKGGCGTGGEAPPKKGDWGAKPLSLGYILLCLDKVRKVIS